MLLRSITCNAVVRWYEHVGLAANELPSTPDSSTIRHHEGRISRVCTARCRTHHRIPFSRGARLELRRRSCNVSAGAYRDSHGRCHTHGDDESHPAANRRAVCDADTDPDAGSDADDNKHGYAITHTNCRAPRHADPRTFTLPSRLCHAAAELRDQGQHLGIRREDLPHARPKILRRHRHHTGQGRALVLQRG